jgi:hypothetical protein
VSSRRIFVSRSFRSLGSVALVLLCLCVGRPSPSGAAPVAPAEPGRLEYQVAWNGFPAARAVVTIAPRELAGRATLDVAATASTNAFVSLFWRYSGTLQTTMLADGPAPLHFDYRRDMAGKSYATTIDFDQAQAHSVYVRGDRRRDSDIAATDLLDPVTAVFRARYSDAGPGDSLVYDVWTGEVRYRVQLDIARSDPVEVPAGRFAALQVVPKLWRIEGQPAPDTRLRRATIWVSDDPAHLLLRIRSRVFIGSVTLDLVQLDPPA